MEKEFQRWTAKRKVELLLQLIKGEVKLVDACREHDLKQSEVEAWMETFVQGGERSLRPAARMSRPSTSAKCASCAPRWANSSWSWTPEKNWTP